MKPVFVYSIVLVISIFFPALGIKAQTTSPSAVYYVSAAGNDSHSGTLSQPFLTIQKGINMVKNPGDQVLIMPGTYTQPDNSDSGQVAKIENKHGSANKNILIKAYDPNNRPVLKGNSGLKVIGSTYITVEGLEVTDFIHSGIPIYLSDYITIRDNYIHLDYEKLCTLSESQNSSSPNFGCSFYSSVGIGDIIGRHTKDGNLIVEHDGKQNTGVYICKSSNNQITNNYIVNLDESIYSGSAGDVLPFDCWTPTYATGELWTENNVFSDNKIENSWNEAIELKPDNRNSRVINNVIKNTRTMIETSLIDIRGHDNEVSGNIIVGAPNTGVRILSETVSDPATDRNENYKKSDGSYKSSFENYVHHNYIYSWAEYFSSAYGILSHESSAANRIEHNTIVGINGFTGSVSEYDSIKSNSSPSNVIRNNLMIGARRVDNTTGQKKYESHLNSYSGMLPSVSDYNAYYPKFKTNGSSCVVGLGSVGVVCQNNNSHNQSAGYEYHSQFLDANPIRSSESACSTDQLLTLPITQLAEKIKYCSSLTANSPIQGKASDATNIGAWQAGGQTTPSPTTLPTKPGDANSDGIVDGLDYVIWLINYAQRKLGSNYGDFNTDGVVDGLDYVIWLFNYSYS